MAAAPLVELALIRVIRGQNFAATNKAHRKRRFRQLRSFIVKFCFRKNRTPGAEALRKLDGW